MKKARGDRCRLCGISSALKRLTTHHLVPRWKLIRRGDISLIGHRNNLVLLCEKCHRLIEAKEASGGCTHRARLRAGLTQGEVDFIRSTMGASWLQWRYPIDIAPRALEPRQLVTDRKTGRIKEIAASVLAATSTESGGFPEGNDGEAGAT